MGSHYRMLDIRSHTETDNFGEAFCPSLPCELFLVPVPLKDLTIMHLQIDIDIVLHLIELSGVALHIVSVYTVYPFQAREHFLHPA